MEILSLLVGAGILLVGFIFGGIIAIGAGANKQEESRQESKKDNKIL